MAAPDKAAGAFRTIGELSRETGVPQHILRYWETRFTQLRPLQRAGNRRYYRPDDAALVRRIQSLLETEGYTIRGVQKLLDGRGAEAGVADEQAPRRSGLQDIRQALVDALMRDDQAAPSRR